MRKLFDLLSNFVQKHFVLNFLFLLTLATSYALLHPSFFHVHDFTHAARIAEMSTALSEGQWPVRWSGNFGYGFGMPLFNFYAPLPYFLGALLDLVGVEIIANLKILYLLCGLITMLGAYLFGRLWLGRMSSLILSAVYLLAPYRAVNLFVRGALSEIYAMAFLPWVLWAGLVYIKQGRRAHLFYLLLALVAIILSHNLTALMFIPLSGLLFFVYLIVRRELQKIWSLLGTYALAFLSSAFYSLPSFLEKDFTQIHKIFSGYFYYSHHFLYIRQFFQENWQYGGSAWGPDDNMSFFLGSGALLSLLVLSLGLWQRKKELFRLSDLSFWLWVSTATLLVSLFLTLFKSQWLWDHFFLLPYIQFPWRFLSIASLFIAILSALSVQLIRSRLWRFAWFLLLSILIFYQTRYFQPESYLDDPSALYYTDPARIRAQMSETLPDYIPIQMAEEKVLRQYLDHPVFWSQTDAIVKGELMVDRAFEKLILLDLKEESLIDLKIASFPGWQVEIDGQSAAYQVNPELGSLQVMMPAGEHKLGVLFTQETLPRQLGNGLSAVGLLLTIYFFWPFAKTNKPGGLRPNKSKN